jgi:hypothetical protein
MNIYGDWGNALVLQQRLRWHGYTPELLEYNVGDEFPADVDIIVGGGGQDSGQLVIQDDLQSRASLLKGTWPRTAPPCWSSAGSTSCSATSSRPAPARSSPASAFWTWKPTAPTSGSSATSR